MTKDFPQKPVLKKEETVGKKKEIVIFYKSSSEFIEWC